MIITVGRPDIDGAAINRRRVVNDGCGRVEYGSRGVDDGSGLIDDGLLDDDGLSGLGVNDGGAWLLHDDLLRDHGSRLVHDYGSLLIDDGGGIHIDWR